MTQPKGIVYLVQPAELVGTARYKVGYSSKPNLSRLTSGYKCGTRYLIVCECSDALEVETELKVEFNRKFRLVAGREYFEGDEIEMIKTFWTVYSAYALEPEDDSDSEDEEDSDGDGEEETNDIDVNIDVNIDDDNIVNVRVKKIKKNNNYSDGGLFACEECDQRFTTKRSLNYHITHKACKHVDKIKCLQCSKLFTTKQSRDRHMRTSCSVNNKKK